MPHTSPSSSSGETGEHTHVLDGMDVLLVDDDPRMRQALRRALRDFGFHAASIIDASDGAEALRQLEQLADSAPPPRLIVTDCQMPHMDGIRLTRALRAAGVSVP